MVPGGGRAQHREKGRARGRQLGTGWDGMGWTGSLGLAPGESRAGGSALPPPLRPTARPDGWMGAAQRIGTRTEHLHARTAPGQ